ncbi:hypothetical protein LPJ66_008246, partial [Kickxella alabastrina]
MHSSDESESESAGPRTLAERIARLGLEKEASGAAGKRVSMYADRERPYTIGARRISVAQGARGGLPSLPSLPLSSSSEESVLSGGSSIAQPGIHSMFTAPADGGNPFASPELGSTPVCTPLSPIAPMPPVLARRNTDTPAPLQNRLSRAAPPLMPKPPGISAMRSPLMSRAAVGTGRGGSLPPPPPPSSGSPPPPPLPPPP